MTDRGPTMWQERPPLDMILAIYTAPGVEWNLEPVKQAKAALDLPFKVYPEHAQDQWYTGARVLAIGGHPPYLCDYFLVGEHAGQDELKTALSWVLGTHDDLGATNVEDTLTAIFGAPVREISPAELESERRYTAYMTGAE